jgi:enhancer of mRNA-decapping protein 4
LTIDPLPLSQVVLLHLLRQLTYCININSAEKFVWMTDVANAIIPTDPSIAVYVRPIYNEIYDILNNPRNLPTITGAELESFRILMQVITSTLGSHV